MRPAGQNGFDASSFHYSIYRCMTVFLGMDHEINLRDDLPRNWIDAWNLIFVSSTSRFCFLSFGIDSCRLQAYCSLSPGSRRPLEFGNWLNRSAPLIWHFQSGSLSVVRNERRHSKDAIRTADHKLDLAGNSERVLWRRAGDVST